MCWLCVQPFFCVAYRVVHCVVDRTVATWFRVVVFGCMCRCFPLLKCPCFALHWYDCVCVLCLVLGATVLCVVFVRCTCFLVGIICYFCFVLQVLSVWLLVLFVYSCFCVVCFCALVCCHMLF